MLCNRTGGARHRRPHVRLSGCVCVKWLDGCTELVRQDQEGHRGCEGRLARAPGHRRLALCALMRPVHPRLPIRATDSVQSVNQPWGSDLIHCQINLLRLPEQRTTTWVAHRRGINPFRALEARSVKWRCRQGRVPSCLFGCLQTLTPISSPPSHDALPGSSVCPHTVFPPCVTVCLCVQMSNL